MSIDTYLPVWNTLTDSQQLRLRQAASYRSVPAGTLLHSDSDECTGLLLVCTGQLRAYAVSPEGREITLYRLLEGDLCLFSASCIMNGLQFRLMVSCEKAAELWKINAETYKQIMAESAALANYTNEILSARFSDVLWLMEQAMWNSMDQRTAAFLLEESALENTLQLSITHETIANHLGTHREVITRMLRYLQKEGGIQLSRRCISISNPEILMKIAGTDHAY